MSGLLLFAWIMVLAVIIATIVIFFKNRMSLMIFRGKVKREKKRNFLIEQMMRRDIK